MRQVVLDTETTGLETSDGHRIIEIGAIEIINRQVTDRFYHQYLNPEREIDAGAEEVHGISLASLQDKPKFNDVCEEFLSFVRDSELIIHNAAFDIGFLNYELHRVEHELKDIYEICKVTDTLKEARNLHPGQRNSLDALCKRYEIDNSHRELHGALLDAQILADVYLAMTGGQVSLSLAATTQAQQNKNPQNQPIQTRNLKVVSANQEEMAEHEKMLLHIAQNNDKQSTLWSEMLKTDND
ncbi:MAG: DNA polymerase III subunit epsilon [Gammaproteobacteria bacterium]|nr:DNA polymerase III subunit epsilon [Gammaproteobacteria bacterium]